jgi:serine protease Do
MRVRFTAFPGRLVLALLACLTATASAAERVAIIKNAHALESFSESIEALAAKVSPSVVQIVVDCYNRESATEERASKDRGDRHAIGSGVIIDPSGYIVTNAHVVENAWRIRVRLSSQSTAGDEDPVIDAALLVSISALQNATLVGAFKEGDLALLKIEGNGLPALRFADYRTVRQGQVVFAFGSREGLHNSVSMGVISSVARQLDTDSPFIYIQTDAAINPGDSGGPLVNTAGDFVGLDTLILRNSCGSEGLGFAIPSTLVQLVADELKNHGHFRRRLLGIGVQSLKPDLAAALSMPRTSGVIVSDVLADSPAAKAGLEPDDVILTVDGHAIRNLPFFMLTMLTARPDAALTLSVLRGNRNVVLHVTPVEERRESESLVGLIQSHGVRVPQLGVLSQRE